MRLYLLLIPGLSLAAACGADADEAPAFTACSSEVDRGIDGVVDQRWSYFYDAAGYPLRSEADGPIDQHIDEVRRYQYVDRNLVHEEIDLGNDGRADYTYRAEYGPDDVAELQEWDSNGDGWPDSKVGYQNAGGRHTAAEWDIAAGGASAGIDGVIDARDHYVYEGETLARIETDTSLDGTPDNVWLYEYDARGNVVALRSDEGMDGSIEYSFTYAYDSHDRVARQESDFGVAAEGADYVETNTWNDDDTLAIKETETRYVVPSETSRTTYAYCDQLPLGRRLPVSLPGPASPRTPAMAMRLAR